MCCDVTLVRNFWGPVGTMFAVDHSYSLGKRHGPNQFSLHDVEAPVQLKYSIHT